ncbi:hypothetical protein ACTFIV_000683 [Dictyostelium citrinum]
MIFSWLSMVINTLSKRWFIVIVSKTLEASSWSRVQLPEGSTFFTNLQSIAGSISQLFVQQGATKKTQKFIISLICAQDEDLISTPEGYYDLKRYKRFPHYKNIQPNDEKEDKDLYYPDVCKDAIGNRDGALSFVWRHFPGSTDVFETLLVTKGDSNVYIENFEFKNLGKSKNHPYNDTKLIFPPNDRNNVTEIIEGSNQRFRGSLYIEFSNNVTIKNCVIRESLETRSPLVFFGSNVFLSDNIISSKSGSSLIAQYGTENIQSSNNFYFQQGALNGIYSISPNILSSQDLFIGQKYSINFNFLTNRSMITAFNQDCYAPCFNDSINFQKNNKLQYPVDFKIFNPKFLPTNTTNSDWYILNINDNGKLPEPELLDLPTPNVAPEEPRINIVPLPHFPTVYKKENKPKLLRNLDSIGPITFQNIESFFEVDVEIDYVEETHEIEETHDNYMIDENELNYTNILITKSDGSRKIIQVEPQQESVEIPLMTPEDEVNQNKIDITDFCSVQSSIKINDKLRYGKYGSSENSILVIEGTSYYYDCLDSRLPISIPRNNLDFGITDGNKCIVGRKYREKLQFVNVYSEPFNIYTLFPDSNDNVTISTTTCSRQIDPYKSQVSLKIDFDELVLKNYLSEVSFIGSLNFLNTYGIVVDYHPKGSLNNYIHNNNIRLSMVQKIRISLDISRACSFLHKNGIIHRDLKPDNVLIVSLDPESSICAKLSDFGTSREINGKHNLNSKVGTTRYMSPEALEGLFYRYIASFVHLGTRPRLDQDVFADNDISLILLTCWNPNPHGRPTFDTIIDILEKLLKNIKKVQREKNK